MHLPPFLTPPSSPARPCPCRRRALAHKAQAPLLVVDVFNLKLEEVLREESAAAGMLDDPYAGAGGGFPPEPWEVSGGPPWPACRRCWAWPL